MPNKNKKLEIGILCSGNTCRSPVLAAWIKHLVEDDCSLTIWTAGMNMNNDEINKPVHKEALYAARVIGLRNDLISELSEHRSIKVESITTSANLIIWITEFEKIKVKKDNSQEIRIDFIKRILLDKQADLFLIPEKDTAWETKNNKSSTEQEVCDAYKQQSEKLKQWAEIIYKTIIDK
jgi:protein-tyrosine-phosphatase